MSPIEAGLGLAYRQVGERCPFVRIAEGTDGGLKEYLQMMEVTGMRARFPIIIFAGRSTSLLDKTGAIVGAQAQYSNPPPGRHWLPTIYLYRPYPEFGVGATADTTIRIRSQSQRTGTRPVSGGNNDQN